MKIGQQHVNSIRRLIHQRIIDSLEFADTNITTDQDAISRFIDTELTAFEQNRGSEISPVLRAQISNQVFEELSGYGPIAKLMVDPDVTDILVNAADNIWVDRSRGLERSEIRFDDDAHLRRIIDRLVAMHGKHLDSSSPMVDVRLSDGSRLHAVVPPLCSSAAVVSIRKFRLKPLSSAELINSGFVDEPTLNYIKAKVEARSNIVVAGGASAGKTTMLNFMSGFIPASERVVTVEETSELKLEHPHVIGLEGRAPNSEGQGQIELRELVRTALRMRADRIIIGEVRGNEVLDMLQAMNIGHDGSMTTVHANSAHDVVRRLETLALLGGDNVPRAVIRDLIGASVNLIVQLSRLADGSRRVMSVSEVSYDGDKISLDTIFGSETGLSKGAEHDTSRTPKTHRLRLQSESVK